MSERLIDWSTRPRLVRIDEVTGQQFALRDAPELTGGNWAIVPRVPGEILTAAKYNADRQAAVDNATPPAIDDYSATLAEMQAEANPYAGGVASQPSSLAGELERLRYVLHQLNPSAPAWYAVPSLGFAPAGGLQLANNQALTGWRTDAISQSLIFVGTDNNVYVGYNVPAGDWIDLGNGGEVRIVGTLNAGYINVAGSVLLHKAQWLKWDDVDGVTVTSSNVMQIGNIASPTVQIGTAGAGVVVAKNTAKAWARVWDSPFSWTQYGFSTVEFLSAGQWRFTLAQPVLPIVVATPEPRDPGAAVDTICLVVVHSQTQFSVWLRTLTGQFGSGPFHVVVFG